MLLSLCPHCSNPYMMKSQAGGLAMNQDGYLDANNIQSLELGNLTGTVWGAVQMSYKTMSAMIADLQVRRCSLCSHMLRGLHCDCLGAVSSLL